MLLPSVFTPIGQASILENIKVPPLCCAFLFDDVIADKPHSVRFSRVVLPFKLVATICSCGIQFVSVEWSCCSSWLLLTVLAEFSSFQSGHGFSRVVLLFKLVATCYHLFLRNSVRFSRVVLLFKLFAANCSCGIQFVPVNNMADLPGPSGTGFTSTCMFIDL